MSDICVKGLDSFMENLDKLSKEDFVNLKRHYNKSYNDCSNRVLVSFYKVLPLEVRYKEYIWFFCATLYYYQDGNGSMKFEEVISKSDNDNIKLKFNNILKETLDEDSLMLYKLGQLIRLLVQEGYKIDIYSLLTDLLFWNSETNFIQKKWARKVYSKSIKLDSKGVIENE